MTAHVALAAVTTTVHMTPVRAAIGLADASPALTGNDESLVHHRWDGHDLPTPLTRVYDDPGAARSQPSTPHRGDTDRRTATPTRPAAHVPLRPRS